MASIKFFSRRDSYGPKRFDNVFSGGKGGAIKQPVIYQRPPKQTILTRRDGKTLDLIVSDRKHALFNPANLSVSTSATWGTLNPIGWTHPARQYAHTESAKMTLPLTFDAILMQQLGYNYTNPQEMAVWLNSFLYPPKKGSPPDLLHLRSPGFVNSDWIVESVNISISRWFHDGTPRIYTVNLSLSEFRLPDFLKRHIDLGSRSPDFIVYSRIKP